MCGEASLKQEQADLQLTNYGINEEQQKLLDNNFTYHAPFKDQQNRYVILRAMGKEMAKIILMYTPQSREQSLALTKLEESVMWSNASIARNEKPVEQTP